MPKLIKTTGMKDFVMVGKKPERRQSWKGTIVCKREGQAPSPHDIEAYDATVEELADAINAKMTELRAQYGEEAYYSAQVSTL